MIAAENRGFRREIIWDFFSLIWDFFAIFCQASRYCARFQASSGHSDSANSPGYEAERVLILFRRREKSRFFVKTANWPPPSFRFFSGALGLVLGFGPGPRFRAICHNMLGFHVLDFRVSLNWLFTLIAFDKKGILQAQCRPE